MFRIHSFHTFLALKHPDQHQKTSNHDFFSGVPFFEIWIQNNYWVLTITCVNRSNPCFCCLWLPTMMVVCHFFGEHIELETQILSYDLVFLDLSNKIKYGCDYSNGLVFKLCLLVFVNS